MTSTNTSVVPSNDDEVELAPPGPVVARDEREAQTLEVPEREIFASGAQRPTWIAEPAMGVCVDDMADTLDLGASHGTARA